jgi:hypothetical protein
MRIYRTVIGAYPSGNINAYHDAAMYYSKITEEDALSETSICSFYYYFKQALRLRLWRYGPTFYED